jgi:uncharacterized protein (DUF1501 family)
MMESDTTVMQRCCDEYDNYVQRRRWMFSQNRANFLKTTVGAMAAAPVMPHILLNSALAEKAQALTSTDPILVVIQLAGGNDGLNTIVPYGSDLYYQDRPTIGVPRDKVIPIDNMVGFNPNLSGLKSLYDKGKVAILEDVGYPNSSRSHFEGSQIWETADTTTTQSTGWLGRWLDASLSSNSSPLSAIAIGAQLPMTLLARSAPVTAIQSVDTFKFLVDHTNSQLILSAYDRMYGPADNSLPPYMGIIRAGGADAATGVADLQAVNTKYTPSLKYPATTLGLELQFVAQMIMANLGTRVFHVSLGGFDDHVAEVNTHANLLKQFGDAVNAFYTDMEAQGKADQVVMMTFSEFGRRVKQNAGLGTDHGTASPLFVMGGKVKGGYFGTDPSLTNLDSNGDLLFGIDFRSVYATILDRWLNTNPDTILGGSFERLGFL